MKKGSIKNSLILMSTVPIVFAGIIIAIVMLNISKAEIVSEIEQSLSNEAYSVFSAYESMYEGDYALYSNDKTVLLYKGEQPISEDFLDILHENTNLEFSLFYGNFRAVSSLCDENGRSLSATFINKNIVEEVVTANTPKFYEEINVGYGKTYFAFYLPITDKDGEAVGMIGVAKSSEEVKHQIRRNMIPIIAIIVGACLVAAFATSLFAKRIIKVMNKLKEYIISVGKGKLSVEMDEMLINRDDEFGQMAVASSKMQASLKKLINCDPLTGLYNRRYTTKKLTEIVSNADRTGNTFAISIGDIDFFKKFNDNYGHETGDEVLRQVSKTMQNFMKGKGFAARWGGEEFLLIFMNVDVEKAGECVRSLLDEIRRIEINYGEEILRITMSFGVAADMEKDFESVIKISDERLYYAKEHGRNQVMDRPVDE